MYANKNYKVNNDKNKYYSNNNIKSLESHLTVYYPIVKWVIVIDILNCNLMIPHSIQKTILSKVWCHCDNLFLYIIL